jgi:hypothetical protein
MGDTSRADLRESLLSDQRQMFLPAGAPAHSVLLAYFEQRMRIKMSYHVAPCKSLRALAGIPS